MILALRSSFNTVFKFFFLCNTQTHYLYSHLHLSLILWFVSSNLQAHTQTHTHKIYLVHTKLLIQNLYFNFSIDIKSYLIIIIITSIKIMTILYLLSMNISYFLSHNFCILAWKISLWEFCFCERDKDHLHF